jgi:hypothetical protein
VVDLNRCMRSRRRTICRASMVEPGPTECLRCGSPVGAGEGPKVCRLCAGGDRIRTAGPLLPGGQSGAPARQAKRFNVQVRDGDGSSGRLSQPFRSRWDHKFESAFLQRRVQCELANRLRLAGPAARSRETRPRSGSLRCFAAYPAAGLDESGASVECPATSASGYAGFRPNFIPSVCRKKPGRQETQRVPSNAMSPPGTRQWRCGWCCRV